MKFLNSNVSLQVNADTQLMNDGIKIWWSTFFDQNELFWQLHDSSFIVNGYQLTLAQCILLSIQLTVRLWSDYFGVINKVKYSTSFWIKIYKLFDKGIISIIRMDESCST